MPDTKPLPCPYCGSKSTHALRQAYHVGEPFAVMCCEQDTEDLDNIAATCGVTGPHSASEEGAVTRWNAVAGIVEAAKAEWDDYSRCGNKEDDERAECQGNEKDRCDGWQMCRALTALEGVGKPTNADAK